MLAHGCPPSRGGGQDNLEFLLENIKTLKRLAFLFLAPTLVPMPAIKIFPHP